MESGGHIIVADNDAGFRIMIESVIAEVWRDAHFVFCRDGMDVLDYFEEGSPLPSIILLDLGDTSSHVLKWLREQKHFVDLPVILWSNFPLETEKGLAREYGATDYLKKPDTFSELLEMVRGLKRHYRDSKS